MIATWGTKAARLLRGQSATVTYGLIAVCCVIFVISPVSGFNPSYGRGNELLAAQQAYFERWGVVPVELFKGVPDAALGPFTALFVHGSWLHLLGNMLFLYVFGVMVEERMGRLLYAFFYVCCGYFALLAYAAAHAGSDQTLVGASGAISAVLGAFLYLFPEARVTSLFPFLFFLPLRFPAWVVLPFWVALQWLAAGQGGKGTGVAYLAHLVGFSLGFLFAWGWSLRRTRVHGKGSAPATEGDSQP
ncbi:rhomboid family intramembrane serine protease [Streptomyces sp. Je 1-369]|uniref:rhomboid family intramembrane serine protease n=1 Tax=Streptomyces sp. Je 1-369 TaxID=2966192 RepID=UPI002285CF4D|nr:rhomboid family intramembrane serine protease [Streptomyces sp. Je 1-369]WAL95043.1 rhomboid family intramembrane serine protease [Streptomyces sp. Je 1-369]